MEHTSTFLNNMTLYIASFASAWDEYVYTHTTTLARTRQEAVNKLWEAIIDARYHGNSTITFWNYIFGSEYSNFDPDKVYDDQILAERMTENQRREILLIRRLFPREMTDEIENILDEWSQFDNAAKEEISADVDARFSPFLKSVDLTEGELEMVMRRFSESAHHDTIYFTMEIKELTLPM